MTSIKKQVLLPQIFGARFFLHAFVIALLFSSCKNESNVIGLNVQPEGDILNQAYHDTSTLISFSQKQDSLATDGLVYQLLGSYNDSIFGKTETSIYMEMSISNANPDFGGSPLIDSAVLSLAYNPDYYGKLDQQTVQVFELTEAMHKDSTYYSGRTLTNSGTDLANGLAFTPKPADSIIVGGIKIKPHLRIKLADAFGQNFLDNQLQMTDDATFRNFFKGFYIAPNNSSQVVNEGGIFRFNISDVQTKLALYYHNSVDDSLQYDLMLGANCERFTHFAHDYSVVTDITNQLSDSTLGQNSIYLQAMSGLKAKIKIPYLMNYLGAGRIAVNKAEFILKADPATITANYSAPANLVIEALDANGKPYSVSDASDLSHYYGGAYNATDNQYVFNITRHVQAVLDGKESNYGYNLVISGGSIYMNRIVLGGGGAGINKMIFRITYTKIN